MQTKDIVEYANANQVHLVLIRGVPGSGKSTLAKAIINSVENFTSFETDNKFMVNGEYVFDATKLKQYHHDTLLEVTKEVTSSKRLGVIVANTFTTMKEMQPYFDLAVRINACLTVINACGKFESTHDVPVQTMQRMRQRFEHLNSRRSFSFSPTLNTEDDVFKGRAYDYFPKDSAALEEMIAAILSTPQVENTMAQPAIKRG
jgi:tRNA uridine 5-carbamoylmethylation protein Kti12